MQAILITAYKNYDHLKELVNFFDGRFSIYIHVDKKSTIHSNQLEDLSANSQVAYVSQKYTINWGGINHLKAILELTETAFADPRNTHFHLITGHDYPIVSLDHFCDFMETHRENDFMEYFTLPHSAWPEGGMDRLSRYNIYDLIDGRTGFNEILIKRFSKLQKAIGFKRSFAKNFPPLYGGSTYWSLKRESFAYIFRYMTDNPRFLDRFKYSFCSEEIFFQTILLNSPLKNKVVNDNLRFIVWEERNGNFPANLDCSDWDRMQASSALFARKFEFPVSEELLDKVKAKINL